MSEAERPDLDAGYGRRRRSGPPAEDDRDPVDPPRGDTSRGGNQSRGGQSRDDQAGQASSGGVGGTRTISEAERYRLTRQLGLQVSLAHHDMINAIAAQRQPPQSRKRYILEDAIKALYDREIGGNP